MVQTYAKAGRAATEEQLEAKGTQITNNLTAKGLNFGAQSGDVIHKDQVRNLILWVKALKQMIVMMQLTSKP